MRVPGIARDRAYPACVRSVVAPHRRRGAPRRCGSRGGRDRHGRPPITLDAEVGVGVGETDERIIVHDAGAGVPSGLEGLVFERFFTVATDRGRSESSGLGLAIVRENARQLGGEVRYRHGTGATFEVTLPLG